MPQYNKLVRDKILDIIQTSGATANSRILTDDQEYLDALCKKLLEEAAEVQADPCVEELADTLEVIYALAGQLGVAMADIEKVRSEKAAKRGGFEDRVYLISTEEINEPSTEN